MQNDSAERGSSHLNRHESRVVNVVAGPQLVPSAHSRSPMLTADLMRALQSSAGNRAVVRLVGRVPERSSGGTRTAVARAPAKRMVQREPLLTAAASKSTTPGQVQFSMADIQALNSFAGAELRRLAGNAITRAAEQFHRGCDAVRADIEKSAKQTTELIAMVAEIVMGFAAPPLAGVILANSVIRKSLVSAYAAQAAATTAAAKSASTLDILDLIRDRGATIAPSFLDKVSSDTVKATLTGATKAGALAIKTAGPGLLTGNSKTVLSELNQLATLGAQDMDRSLAGKSESELVAIVAAFDSNLLNESTYAVAIRRYMAEVIPIGQATQNEHGHGTKRLVRMNAYGGFRLAVVESGMEGTIAGTKFNQFVTWVSPAMQESALARAGVTHAGQVPEFDPDKLGSWLGAGSLPAPTAGNSQILDLVELKAFTRP